MALNGFSPVATTIRFKSAEGLFSFVIDLPVPSGDDISKFDTASEFQNLKKDDASIERLRNILLLPTFIAAVILTTSCISSK